MRKRLTFLLSVLTMVSAFSMRPSQAQWMPYGERYAVIFMGLWGGAEEYILRWSDVFGMYTELKHLGFTDENIYVLANGDSVAVHPGVVDTTNTTRVALEWVFREVQKRSTGNDLVYIWRVGHGLKDEFNTVWASPWGSISHEEYARMIDDIAAKQIIGAYDPCYSGGVIDDVSRTGVTSITSTENKVTMWGGWAKAWQEALRGGTPHDPTDTNRDGYISMSEAYERTAIRTHEHSEYPQFDDNGDGMGHGLGSAGYDPVDLAKDGYTGSGHSLTGWWSGESVPVTGIRLSLVNYLIDDTGIGGNGNEATDPGETVRLVLALQNARWWGGNSHRDSRDAPFHRSLHHHLRRQV